MRHLSILVAFTAVALVVSANACSSGNEATTNAPDAGTATRAPGGGTSLGDLSSPKTVEAAPGGASVTLPANGVQRSDGSAPKFPISVAVTTPVSKDMTADAIVAAMPSFAGKDATGKAVVVSTVGLLQVTMTDADGAPLQLKPGSPATVRIPRLTSDGPAQRNLWFYDETAKLWNEYGVTATANGDYFEGSIPHFTMVGALDACDQVCFTGKLVDACDSNAQVIPYLRHYTLGSTACGYPGTDYFSGGATDSPGGNTFAGYAVRGSYTLHVDYEGKSFSFPFNTGEADSATTGKCIDLGTLQIPVCESGCCDSTTHKCQPGTANNACGKDGKTCNDCGTTSCVSQVCTGCKTHADCPVGDSCEVSSGACTACLPQSTGGSSRACPTANELKTSDQGGGTLLCDAMTCVCAALGNGPACMTWYPCQGDPQYPTTEADMQHCGDGVDNDCDGTVDDGCTPCTNDQSCPTLHQCVGNTGPTNISTGNYCETCTAACTVGTACTNGDTVGTCKAYGNGCSRCSQ